MENGALSTGSRDEAALWDLLEGRSCGEPGAEERFVAWLTNHVSRIVRSNIDDSHWAADAVQEIVLKFHLRDLASILLELVRRGESPLSFLNRSCKNALLDLIRKRRRLTTREFLVPPQELPNLEIVDGNVPATEEELGEQITVVTSLLSRLDSEERHLIELHFGLQGEPLGYAEAARMLGISKEAAKKRGQRTLGKLFKMVQVSHARALTESKTPHKTD
ncbi:MAG TPA: RNA polymerase sigma factor [Verrucomicrobiae bacterium]|nr:RNA polymerase sigma factor [Verrucomicrobiae bacterium]